MLSLQVARSIRFSCFIASVLGLALLSAEPVGAQNEKDKPVTEREVDQVLQRMDQLICPVLKITAPKEPINPKEHVANRGYILEKLHVRFERYRSSFKFTPSMIKFDARQLARLDRRRAAYRAKLIEWGFVAPTAPLASGKTDHLTPEQFGDAVGYFMTRVADLTHSPSSKFSPYLMPGLNAP